MIAAQTIACTNNAGFVMSFDVVWFDPNTGKDESSKSTGNYPIDDTRSIDMSDYSLDVGTPIRPKVDAVAGPNNYGDTYVTYAPNGVTAVYDVKGTVFGYSVHLL